MAGYNGIKRLEYGEGKVLDELLHCFYDVILKEAYEWAIGKIKRAGDRGYYIRRLELEIYSKEVYASADPRHKRIIKMIEDNPIIAKSGRKYVYKPEVII